MNEEIYESATIGVVADEEYNNNITSTVENKQELPQNNTYSIFGTFGSPRLESPTESKREPSKEVLETVEQDNNPMIDLLNEKFNVEEKYKQCRFFPTLDEVESTIYKAIFQDESIPKEDKPNLYNLNQQLKNNRKKELYRI